MSVGFFSADECDDLRISSEWDLGSWGDSCEDSESTALDDDIAITICEPLANIDPHVSARLAAIEREVEKLKSSQTHKKEIPTSLPLVMGMTNELFPFRQLKFEIVDGCQFGETDYILITVKCCPAMTAEDVSPSFLRWHSEILDVADDPEVFRLTLDFTE